VESFFDAEERSLFEITHFGFESAGFSKIIALEAKTELMDFRSFQDADGKQRCLYYYPDRLELYRLEAGRLNRSLSFPLKWGQPYYHVMAPEGRLTVTTLENKTYITAGSNFSPSALLLELNGDQFSTLGSIDFTPFRRITLNGEDYLAGGRYNAGRNYFDGLLLLAPTAALRSGALVEQKQAFPFLTKSVPPFYALDLASVEGNVLDSVHLIDREYSYLYLADNFEVLTQEAEGRRGAALSTLDGQWLAVSDYSSGYDVIYFYKIEKGRRNPVYQNSIAGEVVFISEGIWKAAHGFWVYVKSDGTASAPGKAHYTLQFWSKKSE